jgi:peptide/nickel transport system permease protein
MGRIVRGQVLQLKKQEYVTAAVALGASNWRIIRRHLLPNAIGALVITTCLQIPSAIFLESFLSFLGLGLPVDELSWGSILSLANKALITNSWWIIVIPGLFLVVTLLCITNLGNHLRKETNRKSSYL